MKSVGLETPQFPGKEGWLLTAAVAPARISL
jgi:hypothetical protein